MAGEALHSSLEQNTGLDIHQETTYEILSRLDDEAIASLAETGTVEDVRAVVEMLIADNPELRPYLIEFQEANSAALAVELQRAAANDNLEAEGEDEAPEEEMHELIEQAQSYLYESLDIDENHANNGALTNFAKGMVDTLIFENGDLALQVIETRGGVILDALKQLATWRGIKGVLQALGESIWDLFSGDAYEKGKAVADLGLVATGVGVAATVGRKAVRSAVNTLDTPSPNNLDRALIDDISKLPDAERLEAAGVFLGRDIPENQRQAILDAHNYGERLEDGSYSLGDLREKTRILREAGFTSGEIRTLFDNNICGKEFPSKSLLDDPIYNLQTDEILDDLLSRLDANDIIGEGENAIILPHPDNPDLVIKVAKEGSYVDDIAQEYLNHNRYYQEYIEGINGENPALDDSVQIPEPFEPENLEGGYFFIERIQGQTLYTKFHREHHSAKLQELGYTDEMLDTMNDGEFKRMLKSHNLETAFYNAFGGFGPEVLLLHKTVEYSDNYKAEHMQQAIDYFGEQGLEHTDFHSGNIMVDNKGIIYIIDFGRVSITEK